MIPSAHPNKIDVSIVIPAKNEEQYIKKCLVAVIEQRTEFLIEILVIDSGSVDKTLQITREFPQVKVISIIPEEFGHGKTRNLGAKNTSGQYIVFLNGDAIPADRNWLDSLIKCLAKDQNLAGVFSRHIPRNNCHLFMARDLSRAMPAKPREISRQNSMDFSLFSTVSAAIPRKIWQTHPFDEQVAIAEDQNWAKEVLRGPYKIRYEPDSMVVHSHNFSYRELFVVKMQIGRVLKGFNRRVFNVFPGLIVILVGLLLKMAGDTVYIIFKKLSCKNKCRELAIAMVSRIFSFAGKYIGWITS